MLLKVQGLYHSLFLMESECVLMFVSHLVLTLLYFPFTAFHLWREYNCILVQAEPEHYSCKIFFSSLFLSFTRGSLPLAYSLHFFHYFLIIMCKLGSDWNDLSYLYVYYESQAKNSLEVTWAEAISRPVCILPVYFSASVVKELTLLLLLLRWFRIVAA